MKVGYLLSAALFAGIITLVTIAHLRFKLDAVLAFWIAYIVTRPPGASMGDYLSQTRADGGLNWGTVITSVIFLSAILLTVVYLTVTKKDLDLEPAAA